MFNKNNTIQNIKIDPYDVTRFGECLWWGSNHGIDKSIIQNTTYLLITSDEICRKIKIEFYFQNILSTQFCFLIFVAKDKPGFAYKREASFDICLCKVYIVKCIFLTSHNPKVLHWPMVIDIIKFSADPSGTQCIYAGYRNDYRKFVDIILKIVGISVKLQKLKQARKIRLQWWHVFDFNINSSNPDLYVIQLV